MGKYVKFTTILIMVTLILVSCRKGATNHIYTVRDTLNVMQSHSVNLSFDKMLCCVPDNDTVTHYNKTPKYNLVVFVDSTKCSPCIINKMYYWNDLIEKTRLCKSDVRYIFIFEPKPEQLEDACLSVKSSGLINEIYLDTASVFRKNNPFIPKEEKTVQFGAETRTF